MGTVANLVEHNPNPVLQLDTDGRLLYANPAAYAIFDGTPPGDWIESAQLAFQTHVLHRSEAGADGPASLVAEAAGEADAPATAPASFTYETGDGPYLFTLLPDPDSMGLLAFGQDIRSQRRLENALQQVQAAKRLSEERFNLASRAAVGILYDWNFQTNEVYRSSGLAQMIGFPVEQVDLSPDWWQARIHPDDYAGTQETVAALRDGKSDSISFEYRVRHADGHWVYVWDRGYIQRDDHGHVLRLVGITSDITERKRREKKVAFLAKLAEELAEMTSPKEAAELTACQVGEYVEAARCVVTLVEDGEIWVESDYPPHLPELDEAYTLGIFSNELQAAMQRETQMVVTDCATDPRTAGEVSAGRLPAWVGAFVSTQGKREERWLGSLTVVSQERRTWRSDELDLLHQANDLMWLAIEKTRLLAENRWGEQLFVRLLNEIPAGIAFLSGPEHRYTMVNAAFQRITAGRGDLIGRTAADVWPEMAEEWTTILDDVFNSGETFYRENLPARIQRRGQIEDVNFNISCSLVVDPGGDLSGLLLMMQEITGQVKAQQAIQEERARLKALIEYAPVGVVLCDAAARITLINPTAERLYGRPVPVGQSYASHQVLQLSYPDGTPYEPRDLPLTKAALDGVTSRNVDMLIIWPDGQRRPLLVNAAPVRSENDRLIGGVAMFQDISERMELRGRLAYQAQVLETVHDAIFSTDADLKITSWNRAAEALYGWNAEEMIGQSAWEQLTSPDESQDRGAVLELLQQVEALHSDQTHSTRAGRRLFVDVSVTAMKDRSGRPQGYVAAIRDVTARREAEDALRKYAAHLERSNRDLEDFAFIASHDMQEPLRKVRAFGDLLKTNYREYLDDRGAEYVDRMVNAAIRMQRMLDSLLAYSRVSTRGQPFQAVDLNVVVAAALEDLEDRLRKTGGVVDIGQLPTIEADPQQIEQIFQNLIGNALKFHAPYTTPRVRVEGRMLPEGLAEITISDQGVGFSMEFADRLFQPFQRLHGRSAYEGNGVGLAICRKIVERHNGSITASSAPGKGATFVVTLPVKAAG